MERHTQYHPTAEQAISSFHPNIVGQVQQAVQQHDVVVVGMFLNPYVLWVRLVLRQNKIPYHYLQYGGYLSKWKHRLAIKIWSAWPTFPQVFVKGSLIGGCSETRKALQNGTLQQLIHPASTG